MTRGRDQRLAALVVNETALNEDISQITAEQVAHTERDEENERDRERDRHREREREREKEGERGTDRMGVRMSEWE